MRVSGLDGERRSPAMCDGREGGLLETDVWVIVKFEEMVMCL